MTDFRKLAEGRPCQIRVALICNRDWATTVLAHLRMAGFSGMGLKAPDWFAAWGCSACHDYVDGRTATIDSYETRRLAHLEGVVRTQAELLELGYLPEAERNHG